MTTFVPGVQRLAVGRSSVPSPPRNWTSIDTGKLWARPMLSGDWLWNMTPLFRKPQAGPPGVCSPTKRYSTRKT